MAIMARDSWTDERLDDLNLRVDRGFEQVDKRFEQVDKRFEQVDRRFEQVDKRFEQVDRRLQRLDERFDALQRTLVTAVIALCSCMITGFASVIALQLGT